MKHDSTRVTLKGGRDNGLVFNPPVTVVQNDLLRYLFADDDDEEPWQPAQPS